MKALPRQGCGQRRVGHKRQHRLADAGAIGWPNLARLRKHFDRPSGVTLVDIQDLTLIHLRQMHRLTRQRRQFIQCPPRQWGKRALRPSIMRQPDQPQP